MIIYINRAKTDFRFSIENVFNNLLENKKKCNYRIYYVPCVRANFFHMFLNMIYVFIISLRHYSSNNIFHITGDIHYCMISLIFRKKVLTIHDCVSLNSSSSIKRYLIFVLWYFIPCKLADEITVISDKTKDELLSLGLTCDFIVIHNSVHSSFFQKCCDLRNSVSKVLIIGTKENKNLKRYSEALSGYDIELHIVGRLSDEITERLNVNNIRYVNHTNLNNEDLLTLYLSCDILLFASTYEGFGMPIIEAQACGLPVITSNILPMSSISSDAAVLVDPFSISSIRSGFNLICDRKLRCSLVRMGTINATKYRSDYLNKLMDRVYSRLMY